ncbi:MAG: DUF2121 domain-containing protein [Methanomicrobiales archaeon]|nr:DUF2121 domain-containing protein [Methanomicrobiales archaeon]
MSLVISFIGVSGAVMAGDMREIRFRGEEDKIAILEDELYSGRIAMEETLELRAEGLGIEISISDTKNKIFQSDGVLIGEVTSTDGVVRSRRRLYATIDSYAIVDFLDGAATIRRQGSGSSFIVLGSEIGKAIAQNSINRYWKGGEIREAIEIIMRVMTDVAEKTATVSRRYVMVQSGTKGDIRSKMRRDGVRLDDFNAESSSGHA